MKLDDFFATITPFLQGRAAHAQVAAALYPEDPSGPDAQRLAIYGRFCQGHRLAALDKVFALTQRVVKARQGEAGWLRLCAGYYDAHPMRSWELNENGQHLPAYLQAAELGLPPWLWELADLEWWEWQTLIAPDAAEDASDEGPLRLGATVELRGYSHAVLSFLDEVQDEDELAADAEPAPEEELVLFYRDRALRLQREVPEPLTLLCLKAVSEGLALAAVAAQVGAPAARLAAQAGALHQRGVLRGA